MSKENDENKGAPAPDPFKAMAQNNIKFSMFGDDNLNDMENKNDNKNEIKKDKKIWNPRDYQRQIYEKALTQNSIIYVETGKGKTFIAIMLMAHYLGIDIGQDNTNVQIDKNKKIIFFVCDTALINQQKKHIEEILKIQVGTIQGKKDKKSKRDYEDFIKKWNSFNIFVAIPSIIYKILSCGFINIFQITMLIFDECHHADSDHPYNKIMDEFYFYYKKNKAIDESIFHLPRIYGLTASPMKTRINGNSHQTVAYQALIKLSENLDSVVIIDPETLNFDGIINEFDENDEYKNEYVEIKPQVDMQEYKKLIDELYKNFFIIMASQSFTNFPEKYQQYSSNDCLKTYLDYVIEKFKVSNLVNYNNICQNNSQLYNLKNYNRVLYIFEKIQRHIFLILENLCLDSLIIYFDKLIQIYNKLYQIKEKEEEEENENSDNDSSSLNNCNSNEEDEEDEEGVLKLESDDILKLKNIFEKINNYLKLKKGKGELFYTSDRLNKLYYTINKLFENDKNAKFIIFITNRIVAHILNPTLSRYLEEKFPDKKSQEIIGLNKRNKSQSSLTLAPTITLNKLNQIVKDFNENKFDILIGTSAVEEGLDIQSCNAVISLAEIQTPKSYIQMKGRARKTNSRFYIFSYSKEETTSKVRNFLEIQKKMRELFNDDIKKDFRRNNYIYSKKEFVCHFDPDTHSKLTLGNVSIFYNDIKQQIDLCEVKFIPKITIENVKNVIPSKFIGKISLNTDLKKIKNGLSYKTNMCSSKDEAIKKCQFWLLIGLIQTGYLDKHLKFCKEKIKNNQ